MPNPEQTIQTETKKAEESLREKYNEKYMKMCPLYFSFCQVQKNAHVLNCACSRGCSVMSTAIQSL